MGSRSSRRRASVPATVLVAEDHAEVRAALSALLESAGYRVLAAQNGREAIELARAERPDIVLMDVVMPECDGIAATRALRSGRRTRRIPVVALTALEGAEAACRAAGVDEVLRKPVDGRALVELVRRWTGSR